MIDLKAWSMASAKVLNLVILFLIIDLILDHTFSIGFKS